jgi:ligand-binding SRPBCC domain-containing protein
MALLLFQNITVTLFMPGKLLNIPFAVIGIPLYWMTEITHLKEDEYFIDEQHFGPYSMWHHQHHFKKIENGVLTTDIVYYKIPFWFLGDAASALFIPRQLKEIFSFHYQKTAEAFGEWVGEKQPMAFFR